LEVFSYIFFPIVFPPTIFDSSIDFLFICFLLLGIERGEKLVVELQTKKEEEKSERMRYKIQDIRRHQQKKKNLNKTLFEYNVKLKA
jgi:hypothetical protein